MALQTSGAISIIDLVDEFQPAGLGSLSAPHSLSEFYSVAAGIPASGTISLEDFYEASAETGIKTITEGTTSYNFVSGKLGGTDYLYGYGLDANEVRAPAGDAIGTWNNSSFGSISPTTYNGVTIEGAAYYTSTFVPLPEFIIVLQGNRAKSFFATVTPQGGNTLTSASATHSYTSAGNYTKWFWREATYGETAVLGAGIAAQWNGTGTSTITFT